jgi:hypothetical protein
MIADVDVFLFFSYIEGEGHTEGREEGSVLKRRGLREGSFFGGGWRMKN